MYVVPQPPITISGIDPAPVIGQPFNPVCEASVPDGINGTVTVTWLDLSGAPVATDTSDDTASATLNLNPFSAANFGMYECQTTLMSPSLERPLLVPTTLTIDGTGATVSPPDRVATLPPEVTPATGTYEHIILLPTHTHCRYYCPL